MNIDLTIQNNHWHLPLDNGLELVGSLSKNYPNERAAQEALERWAPLIPEARGKLAACAEPAPVSRPAKSGSA